MVKVAVIGAGGIAHRHVETLQKIEKVEIIGIHDIKSDKAKSLASQCGAKVFEKMEDSLKEVDAVYILTPPSSHREIAVKAMDAGKHVICEKPIAITLEDAEIMIDKAKANNVKLFITFNMRFRKSYERLKEIVDSGKLGEMITFWNQRMARGLPKDYNWRTDPELLCGITIESLSHDIDLVRWIGSDIVDVRGRIFASNPEISEMDDNSQVMLTLENGATANIHVSWSSYFSKNSRGVVGTRGTVNLEGEGMWDCRSFQWQTENNEEPIIENIEDSLDEYSYLKENEHFIECIEKEIEPIVTGKDGLEVLKISHAILKSHKTAQVVKIDDIC